MCVFVPSENVFAITVVHFLLLTIVVCPQVLDVKYTYAYNCGILAPTLHCFQFFIEI